MDIIKKLRRGIFPNEKNRVWTMCNVVIKLATQCMEEAEKNNLTGEQFYINFEDILNLISVKDHTSNENQSNDFIERTKQFMADSE